MYVRHKFPLCNEAPADDGSTGSAAAAAPAPAAAAPAAAPAPVAVAPVASPAPAVSAPAAPAPQPGSLMARGSAAPAAGPAPAASAAPAGDEPAAIADKFIVKTEAGEIDWQASALKQAQAYSGLEQRMGAGEAPPKTADEYAPELPEGITMDTLKGDPMYAGFLKGAHAKGLNNGQVSYILGEFQTRMQMMRSPEAGEAELIHRLNVQPEQLQNQVYAPAYRAAKAFAVDDGMMTRLDTKFGSDPDYLQLMARIGKELGEDKPVNEGLTPTETNTLDELKQHPAYSDAKHVDHVKVKAQVKRLYDKQFADAGM